MAWYGKRYRELARDPVWFANLLVADADMEGYSSRQIWAYANSIGDVKIASDVRVHAVDESRHSKLFGKIIEIVFPHAIDKELREKLEDMSPELNSHHLLSTKSSTSESFISEEQTLNILMLMNLYEIQALILQMLLQPTLLAHSASHVHPTLQKYSRSLIYDELRHIKYTAEYIERAMMQGRNEYVRNSMVEFQNHFNQLVLEKVASEGFV
jgi:hypothetical protein